MAGGWAFVGTGSSATTPGGNDTNIQFNNNGSFSGSALLITDGSGSLSASVNISASAFYGDGSNLTGLTASAVNVADGPEQAIQFRVDTPVSGEISGSSYFMFMTASNTVQLDGASLSSSLNVSASAFYGELHGPFSAGTDDTVLVFDGTKVATDEIDSRVWGATLVDASGTPVDSQIGVWTDANTMEGDSKLTWDGSTFDVTGSLSASANISGSGLYIENALISSSANGSIDIGQGITYTFGGKDLLDVFEGDFKLRSTDYHQAISQVQTSNFNIQGFQTFVVDCTGSVITGTLPGIAADSQIGLTYTVKDLFGSGSTNNVVIEPSGSQKIDGGTAAKIQTNYGALTIAAFSSSVRGYGWGIVSTT